LSSETGCSAEAPTVHLLDFGSYGRRDAVDAAYSEAKTHGYAAGYAAGMRAATDQARAQREQQQASAKAAAAASAAALHRATSSLETAAQAFERQVAPAVESAETTLVAASLELAEAILGTELQQGPHSAQAALTRALAELELAEVRRVRMHPQSIDQLPQGAAERAGVRLVPDIQLQPGDAVADLPEGFLDARIQTALDRCRSALEAHLAQRDDSGRAR